MKFHSTYYGVDIYRQPTQGAFGYRLPWIARIDEPFLPLAGIRAGIKQGLGVA